MNELPVWALVVILLAGQVPWIAVAIVKWYRHTRLRLWLRARGIITRKEALRRLGPPPRWTTVCARMPLGAEVICLRERCVHVRDLVRRQFTPAESLRRTGGATEELHDTLFECARGAATEDVARGGDCPYLKPRIEG